MNEASAYAPANIALAKYWGKRNEELNLPITSSLSISLNQYGATTTLKEHTQHDYFQLNGHAIEPNTEFSSRLTQFLERFRPHPNFYFEVDTHSTVPIAAGVASSACGFAALTLALNSFLDLNLDDAALSILARRGSGSACRSLWHGFVEWQAGKLDNGMDSFATPLPQEWHELRIGLLLFNTEKKSISSRAAMHQTVLTSPFYREWPQIVAKTLVTLHSAIDEKDFSLLGATAEANALAMHSTMLTSEPSICYWLPETVATMQKIWQLRAQGLELYFTQDAGPNLKLLYLQQDEHLIQETFPSIISIAPWNLQNAQ
jgi:diphosphomevalonate decarboxylase